TLCVLSRQERRFLDAASGQPLAGQRGDFPAWDWLTDPLVRCSANGKTAIKIQPIANPVLGPYYATGTLTAKIAAGKQRTISLGQIFYYPMLALSSDGKFFVTTSPGTEVRSADTGVPIGKPLTDP